MNKIIRPCCLTIAGSDSGGNAGIQADLRAFHSYNVHGCTVIATLTAQNPFGVSAIHPVPAEFVGQQLDAVLGTYQIKALKTGMLSNNEIITTIADRISAHNEIAKIIDPVMIATSGAKLISNEAIETLKQRLLPIATLITPNIPEAETLTSLKINSRAEVKNAAKKLYENYGCAVLIKGGHAVGDLTAAEDTFFNGSDFQSFFLPWIDNPISTHGTGCSMAAAIAAETALGHNLLDAIRGAKDYVHQSIANSYLVGKDCGVLGWAGKLTNSF